MCGRRIQTDRTWRRDGEEGPIARHLGRQIFVSYYIRFYHFLSACRVFVAAFPFRKHCASERELSLCPSSNEYLDEHFLVQSHFAVLQCNLTPVLGSVVKCSNSVSAKKTRERAVRMLCCCVTMQWALTRRPESRPWQSGWKFWCYTKIRSTA
jgi:hypothetical protein